MGDTKLLPEDIYWSEYPERIPGVMYSGSPRGIMAVHKPTATKVICDHFRSQHENRDACLRALSAALLARQEGEDARDAARYRWLRDRANVAGRIAPQVCVVDCMKPHEFRMLTGDDVDAAIDAARSGGGG